MLLRATEKAVVGHIWPMGHYLPTPALDHFCSAQNNCHCSSYSVFMIIMNKYSLVHNKRTGMSYLTKQRICTNNVITERSKSSKVRR